MSSGATIADRAARQSVALQGKGGSTAERLFRACLHGAVAVGALCLIALIVRIVSQGGGRVSTDLLTNQPSKIVPETSGIQSAILGTLYLMGLCAVLVIPVGVATAIYLEEYADRKRWWNRLIELNIQNLAAVPSVVYGILGLAFIVRGPIGMGPVLLAGAITLSLLVLPVVIIVSREAIRAVPSSIRDGALALGATKWQSIWKQVLPGSIAGIATGVILALSRAIGETAPLIVIGAAVSPRFNPDGLLASFTALPIQIFAFSKDNDSSFIALAAAAIIVLMALLLAMNSIAIYLRNRYEQKW
ncbi:MAG: phosphate transport system permease protein [Solirubrobacteraceae bacterium]|nr:phosphate transport system permease protein [Solirubrobacteraceae bacterium]